MTKYIFVTGGVVSGLGKGVTVASIGRILKSRGVKVAIMKLDPYLNVDPGTMSPYQHGEVFVTEDGAETDLDLGHCASKPWHLKHLSARIGRTSRLYSIVAALAPTTASQPRGKVATRMERSKFMSGYLSDLM